ncbi:MAG: DUF459 domain-containing protein [Mailhella sp.]|nr:DUF459 domain-containing protein [Mailhella sp.]
MTAKNTISIVARLLIALGTYSLFDAESLAEGWKQKGVPDQIADTLVCLGRESGLTTLHARISGARAECRDVLIASSDSAAPAETPLPANEAIARADSDDIGEPAAQDMPEVGTSAAHMPETNTPPGGHVDQTAPAAKTEAPEHIDQPDAVAGQKTSHDSPGDVNAEAGDADDHAAKALKELAELSAAARNEAENKSAEPDNSMQDSQTGTGEAGNGMASGQEQKKDPGTVMHAQADKNSGFSGEALFAPFYAVRESALQEYQHRTVDKKMFEDPLKGTYTVLLAGDSFMEETTLAVGRNAYYKKSGVTFHSIARYSTGLTSIKDWNWSEKLEAGIEKFKPDIVLILLGANDLTGIVEGKKVYAYKSESWREKYLERAEGLIGIALKHNVLPIWIGLPVMVHEPFLTGIPIISAMQHQACLNKNTIYVDTLKTLADENGNFLFYKKDENGKNLRLRKKDKCHIAADGMLLVLDEVMPYVRRYVEYREQLIRENNAHAAKEN